MKSEPDLNALEKRVPHSIVVVLSFFDVPLATCLKLKVIFPDTVTCSLLWL